MNYNTNDPNGLAAFLTGKSETSIALFNHFIIEFEKIAPVTLHPAKTMIGISNGHKRIAWVTQFGKGFCMWCSRSNSLIMTIYASRRLPRCLTIISSLIIISGCYKTTM